MAINPSGGGIIWESNVLGVHLPEDRVIGKQADKRVTENELPYRTESCFPEGIGEVKKNLEM